MVALGATTLFACETNYEITLPQTPYYDNDNKRIAVEPDPKAHPYDISRAKYIEGTPTILYNPRFLKTLPKKIQLFVFYHEIDHFKLNHVPKKKKKNSFDEMELMQHQADCYSIKYLNLNLNYSPKEIKTGIIDKFFLYDLQPKRKREAIDCLERNKR